MVSAVVIYESKYGHTEKYAKWLGEALSAPVFERRAAEAAKIREYGAVIYGGGLYAGGVSGISFVSENFEALKSRELIVFTCGLADTKDEKNVENIRGVMAKKLAPNVMEKIKVFHLRGGIDYGKLSLVHKTMMSMMKKGVSKKEEKTSEICCSWKPMARAWISRTRTQLAQLWILSGPVTIQGSLS